MPVTVPVPALELTTMVEKPSVLPMLLPVTFPTLNRPSELPSIIPIKPVVVPVPVEAVVWLIFETTFPWMLVGVAVLTKAASIPLKVLVDPEMVVVPVLFAAPKPITLLVTVNEPVEFRVMPA